MYVLTLHMTKIITGTLCIIQAIDAARIPRHNNEHEHDAGQVGITPAVSVSISNARPIAPTPSPAHSNERNSRSNVVFVTETDYTTIMASPGTSAILGTSIEPKPPSGGPSQLPRPSFTNSSLVTSNPTGHLGAPSTFKTSVLNTASPSTARESKSSTGGMSPGPSLSGVPSPPINTPPELPSTAVGAQPSAPPSTGVVIVPITTMSGQPAILPRTPIQPEYINPEMMPYSGARFGYHNTLHKLPIKPPLQRRAVRKLDNEQSNDLFTSTLPGVQAGATHDNVLLTLTVVNTATTKIPNPTPILAATTALEPNSASGQAPTQDSRCPYPYPNIHCGIKRSAPRTKADMAEEAEDGGKRGEARSDDKKLKDTQSKVRRSDIRTSWAAVVFASALAVSVIAGIVRAVMAVQPPDEA